MPPSVANGKVCYIEIPAQDVERSSDFYRRVFGWVVRRRDDGTVAFDDGVEVSGAWVTGRPPYPGDGMLVYVMVDDAAATLAKVTANGGAIAQQGGSDPRHVVAKFSDPFGNVMGLYQHGRG
jgi:uncharacterized protein